MSQFHHAGRDNDPPAGEIPKHFEGCRGTVRVRVERIVNDGNSTGLGNKLQAVFHRLQARNAPGDLTQGHAQLQADG